MNLWAVCVPPAAQAWKYVKPDGVSCTGYACLVSALLPVLTLYISIVCRVQQSLSCSDMMKNLSSVNMPLDFPCLGLSLSTLVQPGANFEAGF